MNIRTILFALLLTGCDGAGPGVIIAPPPLDPDPLPEMTFASVLVSHPVDQTVAVVVIRNDGGTGYYKLEFFVPSAAGADSLVKVTAERVVATGRTDMVSWLVAPAVHEVSRIDAYQKLAGGVWTLADVWPEIQAQ